MALTPLLPADPVVIGPWDLVGRLGAGGMGVVYLGTRKAAGGTQQAAVKVISEARVHDPSVMARFRREIATVMGLEDPGIARVVAADLDDQPAWYASDHIDGPTVQDRVTQSGPIPRDLWLSMAVTLLTTLSRVHGRGIVHRDLKPQNILLGPSGPVIIDFGIAAISGATRMTVSGASPRTELWSSPEQLTNDPITPATDIFALGMLLDWAATGRHPFDPTGSSSAGGLVHAILNAEPAHDDLEAQDRTWLLGMVAKDPAARPESVDLLEDLLSVYLRRAVALGQVAWVEGWSGAARTWWQRAADSGDGDAMLRLGELAAANGDQHAAETWWSRGAAALGAIATTREDPGITQALPSAATTAAPSGPGTGALAPTFDDRPGAPVRRTAVGSSDQTVVLPATDGGDDPSTGPRARHRRGWVVAAILAATTVALIAAVGWFQSGNRGLGGVRSATPTEQGSGSNLSAPAVPGPSAPAVPTASPDDESTSSAAGAVPFRGGPCSTMVSGQRVDDVVQVRAGATCVLVDVTIAGNVEVERGGILQMADSTVEGDVQGDGHQEVTVRDSRIGGNIQLVDGGTATVSGVTIDGNLQAEDNTGPQAFSGNTIDGNLQCQGNQPAPTGGGNTVTGNKEDQCSGL